MQEYYIFTCYTGLLYFEISSKCLAMGYLQLSYEVDKKIKSESINFKWNRSFCLWQIWKNLSSVNHTSVPRSIFLLSAPCRRLTTMGARVVILTSVVSKGLPNGMYAKLNYRLWKNEEHVNRFLDDNLFLIDTILEPQL